MVERHSVLIVDRQDETREVLRTVLADRGIEILEAQRSEDGLRLARAHHPDVIVLDLEVDEAGVPEALLAESRQQETPIVVLGSIRRCQRECAGAEVVAKPYHYGPLVRKIEELLAQRREAA
ncbi:MAG: response regulator [Pirellulales bacterium]|nr:response regulator [Pirellulales bacterium]